MIVPHRSKLPRGGSKAKCIISRMQLRINQLGGVLRPTSSGAMKGVPTFECEMPK